LLLAPYQIPAMIIRLRTVTTEIVFLTFIGSPYFETPEFRDLYT
jgi:hypothetical protein